MKKFFITSFFMIFGICSIAEISGPASISKCFPDNVVYDLGLYPFYANWTVTGGTIIGSPTGRYITVLPSYADNIVVHCAYVCQFSLPLLHVEMTTTRTDLYVSDINGPPMLCSYPTPTYQGIYSIDTPVENVTYTWSVSNSNIQILPGNGNPLPDGSTNNVAVNDNTNGISTLTFPDGSTNSVVVRGITNGTATLMVSVTCCQGVVYNKSFDITVGPPNSSNGSFFPKFIGICFFQIRKLAPYGSVGAEYSIDGGPWEQCGSIIVSGKKYYCFGDFDPHQVVNFSYRDLYNCGNSPQTNKTMTMPPEPKECFGENGGNGVPSNDLKVILSPNPVTDYLEIKIVANNEFKLVNAKVKICNVVNPEIIDIPLSNLTQRIDVTKLNKGLYTLCIYTEQQKLFCGLFAK